MLMSAHDGAVDHGVFVVSICREVAENTLPDAGPGPPAEPLMDVLGVAEVLRQIPPARAGAIAIKHRLNKQAVVRRGHPN